MSSNRLKLNAEKTQFIWLGSPQQLLKVGHIRLTVGEVDVVPLDSVRDLSVALDSKLTMKQPILLPEAVSINCVSCARFTARCRLMRCAPSSTRSSSAESTTAMRFCMERQRTSFIGCRRC
jgi:hypothetical protein